MAVRPDDRPVALTVSDVTGQPADTSRKPDAFRETLTPPFVDPLGTRSLDSQPAGLPFRGAVPGYVMQEELGRGGMGIVYRARHVALDRVVALKMILLGQHARPKDLERFRAEALAVARFHHPNIVQIYEVGEADGLPFFSLEFVPGGTLSNKIARDPQAPRYSATTVEALARAMQYAHERGVVHRDLKPSNVLLAEDGTPKIADFGLARRLDDDSGQTQTGQVVGTPSYMAPEQAGGQAKNVGPATDVYALGATLYDLLTGRPPFSGFSVLDTLEMVRTREPVPPGSLTARLPKDLETICLKCLQKDPAKRYATAAALADDLRRYLEGKPILARPVGPVERARRWARRNPVVAGLGSAVAVLLVAVAVITSVMSVRLNEKKREAEDTALREKTAKLEAQALEQKAVAGEQAAVKAQKLEQAARLTAAEQRKLALDTVRDVLVRVDERMKSDARLAPIRLDIIRQMVTNVDLIRDHTRNNPLEDQTEALAYSRMGEVYLRGNRMTDAAEWLTKAHRIIAAAAVAAPTDPAALRRAAFASHLLAEAEWRLGHGARSRALNAEALRLCEQRVKLVAGSGSEVEQADAAVEVADSLALVAYDDLRLGEPERALRNYQAAERAFAALPPPLPNFIKIKRTVNEIHVRTADALCKLNRPDEAQKLFLQALFDREAMAQNAAPQPAVRALLATDVSQSRLYLGDFYLMARKDSAAAALQYGQSLDLCNQVLAGDKDNLDVRQRLAATHYRLGLTAGLRPGVGPLAGAAAEVAPVGVHWDECLRLRESLAKIDENDTQGQVEVLLVYARLGRLDDADKTIERLLKQAGADRQVLFQTACGLAIVGAGADDKAAKWRDRAFDVLTKLVDGGWQDRAALETDPDLAAVRADKRWTGLLERLATQKPEPG